MTTINVDILEKFKKAQKLPARQEGDGHEIEVEVREDEEQSIKLQEIIDILVAAGYFRARIKGLSPFDKVVGGMTWCIESCNVDVDVDLLFQENSTIGQKIALTEKIVSVLPKMQCPYRIEPHQIQGLDFIHIFPVIQWLVTRSMEFRQEMSAFVRSYAVNQFKKEFTIQNKQKESDKQLLSNLKIVNEAYRPHRYYKRKNAPPSDISSRVQITLLEYGHKTCGESHSISSSAEEQTLEKQKIKEQEFQELLSNLIVTKDSTEYEELNEEDLKNLAKHYTLLQLEFKDGSTPEQNQLIVLEEQKQTLINNCKKLENEKTLLEKDINENTELLEKIRLKQQEADKALKELDENEKNEPQNMKEVEELVILNDNLRTQEVQFREHCKKELVNLQNLIEETKKLKSPVENTEEINKEFEEETEKVRIVRLQLARKNRLVAALQRQLDQVPNRPELAQYQRRFLELYNQVAAKHKETKQYYTLYNTLEDTKFYMKKELSLLNSISDSYPEAMQSFSSKEEFLNQFQNIVESVKQSKQKVEMKLIEERRHRDHLSTTLQGLIELQRKYVTTLKQLSIECKKHEVLLSKSKS